MIVIMTVQLIVGQRVSVQVCLNHAKSFVPLDHCYLAHLCYLFTNTLNHLRDITGRGFKMQSRLHRQFFFKWALSFALLQLVGITRGP